MAGTDPVAPNFIAGSGPVPSTFNAWVQAPFAFLTSKVVFRASLQGGQSLTGPGFNHLAYDTILEDPYGGWSSGTNTWTCPAGCSGWFDVTMTAFTGNQSGSSQVQAALYLNGSLYSQTSAVWGVAGHATGSCGSVPIALYGGQDAIGGWVYSTASVSTPTVTGEWPSMEVTWISL